MIYKTKISAALFVLGLLPNLPACGGVTNEEYQGQSLFHVQGTVKNSRSTPVGDVHAGIIWVKTFNDFPTEEDPNSLALRTVPVAGSFPAQFRIDAFEPPPEIVYLQGVGGVRFALGRIFAMEQARDFTYSSTHGYDSTEADMSAKIEGLTPEEFDDLEGTLGVLGGIPDVWVVYLPDGAASNPFEDAVVKGPLAPGFYVFREVDHDDAVEQAAAECLRTSIDKSACPVLEQEGIYEVPEGTPLTIELVDAPDEGSEQ